jgi:replicative DNA helicase
MFAFREHYYLSRAKPMPETGESPADFDVKYHRWANACEEASGKMEIIAAKTRMDETGSNYVLVDLAFDVASDPPATAPTHSYR